MPTPLKGQIASFLSKSTELLNLLDSYDAKLDNDLGEAWSALGGGWSVVVVDKELATGAECDTEQKKIFLSKKKPLEDQATGFIFELGNAAESPKYKKLNAPWNKQELAPLEAGRKKSDIEAVITGTYLTLIKRLSKAGIEFAAQAKADLEETKSNSTIKAYLKDPSGKLADYKEVFALAPHSKQKDAPALAKLPSAQYYAFEFLMETSDGNLAKLVAAALTTKKENLALVMEPIKNLGLVKFQKACCYQVALNTLVELAGDKFAIKEGWSLPETMLDVDGKVGEDLDKKKRELLVQSYTNAKSKFK